MALLLGIGHGLIMYFNEGELENEGIMGLIVIILLLITAIIGTNLFNNRKSKLTNNPYDNSRNKCDYRRDSYFYLLIMLSLLSLTFLLHIAFISIFVV